jgi:hypothetical protein
MNILIILVFSVLIGHFSSKTFVRYVYPTIKKKRPFVTMNSLRPLTCEFCMVFWTSVMLLTAYNFYCGFNILAQLLYIILSIITLYLYESIKRILLR